VAASGWLFDDGRRVLVPLSALHGSSFAWVRNGKGALSRGTLARRDSRLGLAELRLDKPLPLPVPATVAPRDPFAGAIAYAIGYVEGSPNPAWPLLNAGFFGAAVEGGRYQRLDFDDPSLHGGPVFDIAGRLAGFSPGGEGSAGFVPVSRLGAFVDGFPVATDTANGATTPADEIYERALSNTLQVIAPR
ncbi:MAG TPA: serine protease, partial [Usitatibacter sp.]